MAASMELYIKTCATASKGDKEEQTLGVKEEGGRYPRNVHPAGLTPDADVVRVDGRGGEGPALAQREPHGGGGACREEGAAGTERARCGRRNRRCFLQCNRYNSSSSRLRTMRLATKNGIAAHLKPSTLCVGKIKPSRRPQQEEDREDRSEHHFRTKKESSKINILTRIFD